MFLIVTFTGVNLMSGDITRYLLGIPIVQLYRNCGAISMIFMYVLFSRFSLVRVKCSIKPYKGSVNKDYVNRNP